MRVIALAAAAVAAALMGAGVAGRLSETTAAAPTARPAPPRLAAARVGSGAVSLPRQDDGHFWAESRVDGVRVRFLVDTGASAIALTPADARRVGIDVRALAFDQKVSTAGGFVPGAYVILEEVAVGGIVQRDVPALVMPDGLDKSLLGMSFLGRLSKLEATPDALILRR